jgi:hypothetical protein
VAHLSIAWFVIVKAIVIKFVICQFIFFESNKFALVIVNLLDTCINNIIQMKKRSIGEEKEREKKIIIIWIYRRVLLK